MITSNRLNLACGVGMVLGNRALLRAGLRERRDGWRRAAGLVLRGQAASFVLSAFGLNLWSDLPAASAPATDTASAEAHCTDRLARSLYGQTSCHVQVKRGEDEDLSAECAGPSYTLAFQPWVEGPGRFVRPDSWAAKERSPTSNGEATDVLMNVICRIADDGRVDVWVRFNHIGIDGVAAQEILTGLEQEWGFSERTVFPTSGTFAPHVAARDGGREGIVELQTFIDFAPLLAWRKAQNARLTEPMTLSAAMIWCLAKHERFARTKVGTTVEVPALNGLGRGVGVLVTRPADYPKEESGIRQYVRDFNRELSLIRRRQNSGCLALDAAAFLPPRLAAGLLRSSLRGERTFGSMGLTFIKDAKVFGAPMRDFGHPDGFIAVGDVSLPTENGTRVGCVTIKGPPDRIADYPRMIEDAIERCGARG